MAALIPRGQFRFIEGAGRYLYLTQASEVRAAVDALLRDLIDPS